MEREIHDLKQQIINLEDDLDKRNSTMKLFEQEKRVLDQDAVALADELNQCKHNNKEIQQLNFNQNQVIRNLEVQLTETRTKTNQVRETLEEELNRFERKIQDLEMRVHMGLCSEDELKSQVRSLNEAMHTKQIESERYQQEIIDLQTRFEQLTVDLKDTERQRNDLSEKFKGAVFDHNIASDQI